MYGTFLIVALYFYNTSLLTRCNTIDIKTDNLTYLKNYRTIISSVVKSTRKLFIFILPIAVLSIFTIAYFIKEKSFLSKFISEDTTFLQVFGIGIIMAISLALICNIVYALSTKLVYGGMISKLDDIINEIESLKK